MRIPKVTVSLLLAVVAAACAATQWTVNSVGTHRSPTGSCMARISISQMGGFRQLFLKRGGVPEIHLADDVTGIAWLSNSELVYTISPVYGVSGVYAVDCGSPMAKPIRLVAPMTYNPAYPKGADFFELKSVVGRLITYYYGRDVDTIDFTLLRTPPNERCIEKQ